jgi:hypothetical protein
VNRIRAGCGRRQFRCAYNKTASLDPAERSRGVIAWSSGNRGQAVALAARLPERLPDRHPLAGHQHRAPQGYLLISTSDRRGAISAAVRVVDGPVERAGLEGFTG